MNIDWRGDNQCLLQDWDDVEELLSFRDDVRSREPNTQLLFVLDDQDQADYQSGHAASDVWLLGPEDRRERSAIMTGWLRHGLNDATMKGLEGELIDISDRDIDLLGHLDELDRLFQSPLPVYLLESSDPSMGIAALPNGYFHGDLTPAQNYLLAEQLRESFGLEIFGLGASFAGYYRPEPIDLEEAKSVVASVRGLYRHMTDELAAQWAAKTAGQRWFLLSYRGA